MSMVRLIGGPHHGDQRDIPPTRSLITFEERHEERRYLTETMEGDLIEVTPIKLCSYRRVDDFSFRFCPTQTAMGETDVEFPILEE